MTLPGTSDYWRDAIASTSARIDAARAQETAAPEHQASVSNAEAPLDLIGAIRLLRGYLRPGQRLEIAEHALAINVGTERIRIPEPLAPDAEDETVSASLEEWLLAIGDCHGNRLGDG